MIPKIPSAAACDPAHAELIMIGLVILLGIMVKLWWKERKDRISDEIQWKERVEAKLDNALKAHDECQKTLPYLFVSKEEFKELMAERTKQWSLFTDKFDKLMERFWNHSHDSQGKVERQ